jgi:exonuclease-1
MLGRDAQVIYKMDKFGDAIEVRYRSLSSNESLDLTGWTISLVRHMCILSGCDYITSIQGIGLKKAHKLLKQHRTVEKVG